MGIPYEDRKTLEQSHRNGNIKATTLAFDYITANSLYTNT